MFESRKRESIAWPALFRNASGLGYGYSTVSIVAGKICEESIIFWRRRNNDW